MTEESKAYWSSGRSFDMRHVPGPVYLTVEGARVPHQAVWLKPFDPLQSVDGLSDPQRDLAALAYVCDYTILEPVLRVLGLPWAKPGLVTASLDHAMWFHRPGPVSDWLLYVQDAIAADAGRGLGTGRFFTRGYRHLATVVQEGMIRTALPAAPAGGSRKDPSVASLRLSALGHLYPRPPASAAPVARARVHHPGTAVSGPAERRHRAHRRPLRHFRSRPLGAAHAWRGNLVLR